MKDSKKKEIVSEDKNNKHDVNDLEDEDKEKVGIWLNGKRYEYVIIQWLKKMKVYSKFCGRRGGKIMRNFTILKSYRKL